MWHMIVIFPSDGLYFQPCSHTELMRVVPFCPTLSRKFVHITYFIPFLTSTFPCSISVLHLVYAIGGRFLETTGETGNFFPEQHYELALEHLEEVCAFHDVRTIQVLLLLSIYSLRSPKGPGAWTYVGLAIRQCIEMGMHRKTQDRKPLRLIDYETRKRVFWCCYCLDRQVSIILGRPFAISDRDIDVELPLDVHISIEDPDEMDRVIEAMKTPDPADEPQPTGLTVFIYIIKLRQIESRIQQTIYRVDQPTSPATKDEVEGFIVELDRWRDSMPTEDKNRSNGSESKLIEDYDYYASSLLSSL